MKLFGKKEGGGSVRVYHLPLERIATNPYQPRRTFDQESLQELADSIKRYGVVQPIIVRPLGRHFQLVAGERRLKASRMAGKKTIPALVRDLEDDAVMEIAFIENMHRRALNRVEEVEGYMRIAQELGLKDPDAMVKRLGQSVAGLIERGWILSMPPLLKRALVSQMIDEPTARALTSVQDETKLKKILAELYAGRLSKEEILRRAGNREAAVSQKANVSQPGATPLQLALTCFELMKEIINAFQKKGLKVAIRDVRRTGELGVEVVFQEEKPKPQTQPTRVPAKMRSRRNNVSDNH